MYQQQGRNTPQLHQQVIKSTSLIMFQNWLQNILLEKNPPMAMAQITAAMIEDTDRRPCPAVRDISLYG